MGAAAGSLALAGPLQAADAFEWRPWPAGKRVPALDLPQLDGSRWRLDTQVGRVVLANFWATWCAPCRDEMPSLVRLAEQRAAAGLQVVGINYKESAATARRFLDGLGLSLQVLLDSDGNAAKAWTPRIFPSTVVFDRRLRPVGTVVGEVDWMGEAAQRILAPVLAAA
jgi:thiol-disulfide isomerase/thioredoxin